MAYFLVKECFAPITYVPMQGAAKNARDILVYPPVDIMSLGRMPKKSFESLTNCPGDEY